jgi:hypothetical protein
MKQLPQKLSRIEQRQAKDKATLLEILEEIPVIRVACAKSGISRATYYRWLDDDPDFREKVSKRKGIGVQMVNDMAESVIIGEIQKKDVKTAKYWLEKHHHAYGPKRKPPPMPPPPEEIERYEGPWIIKLDT